jgi:CRISPR/Cas system-associated endonuclease/helicase Cas3
MTPPSDRLIHEVRKFLSSLRSYARRGSAIDLYPYQVEAGDAILRSIRERLGLTFVLMFPRQSGKDELLAQLTSYLMRLLSDRERTIIVVNPTYQP